VRHRRAAAPPELTGAFDSNRSLGHVSQLKGLTSKVFYRLMRFQVRCGRKLGVVRSKNSFFFAIDIIYVFLGSRRRIL
jgi:hypothetical protein